MTNRTPHIALKTACFILMTSVAAIAGTEMDGKTGKEAKTIEKVKETCITGDIGINVVSQYVSRGLVFENQGSILQPYADLYFKLYEGEGFINKVSLNLGIWNSFHSRHTDAGLASGSASSSTRSWYEFDFTAGVAVTFAKNFTLTPSWYMFASPNDGFATFHGLNVALAYDTTDLIGFNLAPKVQVLWEMENKAGSGPDEGFYYEIGFAPSVPVGPVTLTFPITAGFGSSDFYGNAAGENEAYGFFSAGVTASYALPFIPECFGTWTVNAGYTYYNLGDGASDWNTAERGGVVRDKSDHEHVFSGGLMVAF